MTAADVKQLLETIVKPLVAEPDQVIVEVEKADHFLNLNLSVAPNDIGRVIGKHGRVAQAIRTIVYSIHLDEPMRVRLNIVDK